MRLVFRLGGALHPVDLVRDGAGWRVAAGGRSLAAGLGLGTGPGSGLVADLDGRPVPVVVARDGVRWWIALGGEVAVLEEAVDEAPGGAAGHGPLEVVSPMPGRVLRVLVTPGERVEPGQAVVSVEAMKMENALRAERPARVARVLVAEGDRVEPGQILVELAPDDARQD